eukprot:422359-Prymnesium_polylepis.1
MCIRDSNIRTGMHVTNLAPATPRNLSRTRLDKAACTMVSSVALSTNALASSPYPSIQYSVEVGLERAISLPDLLALV